jgi:hypothetical protein
MIEEVNSENQAAESKEKGANKPLSKTAKIVLRREKISELMLAGYDEGGVRRITEYLNKIGFDCKKSTVANDINFILTEAAKNTTNNLEQKREISNARLESLIGVHWLDAQKGNLKSGRFVRDLIDDQNELYGLKAAKKLEHSNPDGSSLMEPVAAAVNHFNAGLLQVYGAGDKSNGDK